MECIVTYVYINLRKIGGHIFMLLPSKTIFLVMFWNMSWCASIGDCYTPSFLSNFFIPYCIFIQSKQIGHVELEVLVWSKQSLRHFDLLGKDAYLSFAGATKELNFKGSEENQCRIIKEPMNPS